MNTEYELNLDFDADLSQLSNMDGATVITLTKEEWDAIKDAVKTAFLQAEEQPRLMWDTPYARSCIRTPRETLEILFDFSG